MVKVVMREERLWMLLVELAREIALLLTTLGNVTAAPFSPPGKSHESFLLNFLFWTLTFSEDSLDLSVPIENVNKDGGHRADRWLARVLSAGEDGEDGGVDQDDVEVDHPPVLQLNVVNAERGEMSASRISL